MNRYIVLLLVAAVASLSSSGVEGRSLTPPKKCCFAKQYSAYMTSVTAETGTGMTTVVLQNDFNAQKLVIENLSGERPSYNANSTSKVLVDFKKHLLYVVPGGHPELCQKFPYHEKMQQCIPEEAQFLTSTYMGPEGEGQLAIDVWRVNSSLIHTDAPAKGQLVTIAVSRQGCVPIMEGAHVDQQKPPVQDTFIMFTNFKTKLVNPSAFDLPASCK